MDGGNPRVSPRRGPSPVEYRPRSRASARALSRRRVAPAGARRPPNAYVCGSCGRACGSDARRPGSIEQGYAQTAAFALRWTARGIGAEGPPRATCPLCAVPPPATPRTCPLVKPLELLVLLAAAGCAARYPAVLTPVRIDTSRTTAAGPPAPVGPPTGVRTTEMDPLTRVDRMEWPGPNLLRSASGAPGPEYW